MIARHYEYDEYPPLRLVPREDNWRELVREELEEMNEDKTVFVIMNAWEPVEVDFTLTEIVDSKYYETTDKAWANLLRLAESHGRDLMYDEIGFELEATTHVRYQEYYIEELYRG